MTTPLAMFTNWLALAATTEPADANACALATVGDGPAGPVPNVRIVLMKQHDRDGFLFYSNFTSRKGRELAAHPAAALDFHWKSLKRQVRMAGATAPVPGDVADAYFATRPRDSQLSAWASAQSEPLPTRDLFEARLREAGSRFPGDVPRPPFWGGWRLVPDWIEFWEERPGRQHHRERFDRIGPGGLDEGNAWAFTLLYP